MFRRFKKNKKYEFGSDLNQDNNFLYKLKLQLSNEDSDKLDSMISLIEEYLKKNEYSFNAINYVFDNFISTQESYNIEALATHLFDCALPKTEDSLEENRLVSCFMLGFHKEEKRRLIFLENLIEDYKQNLKEFEITYLLKKLEYTKSLYDNYFEEILKDEEVKKENIEDIYYLDFLKNSNYSR